MFRFPSKTNALSYLNEIGVKFGTIVDVGTHAETPELRHAFPNQKHILFEPAEEFFPKIEANYRGMDWELVPLAVSDTNGKARLRKVAISGGEISHAMISSDEAFGLTDIETVRLDTFFKTRTDPEPFLLKVDVDGFEIPILHGAAGIWDKVDAVIVEATADTFVERLQAVQSQGFRIFDIVDQCYYCGVFSQADIIFLSNRLVNATAKLRPWETEEFSWNKWVPVPNYEHAARAGHQGE